MTHTPAARDGVGLGASKLVGRLANYYTMISTKVNNKPVELYEEIDFTCRSFVVFYLKS